MYVRMYVVYLIAFLTVRFRNFNVSITLKMLNSFVGVLLGIVNCPRERGMYRESQLYDS